jgi:hypothetical protein
MITLAADIVFKAAAPPAVVVGQQFRLTYTLNAVGQDLRLQEMSDFELLYGPVNSGTVYSQENINGQIRSETTVTYTCILMAKAEGSFTIPPATIKVNNSNYTSNALTVKVLPPDKIDEAQSQSQASAPGLRDTDLFVVMQVSKRSVYEQEGLLVTFKLYSRDRVGVSEMKFPEFEGFLAQEVDVTQQQWVLENYNGINYQMGVLIQTVLYPQRAGKLTIESGHFNALVRIRMPRQGMSIFDTDVYQTVNKSLSTTPVTIDVKPLPSGKPASYANAVGNFTLTSDINSTNIKSNEAVTIKINIAGNGNLRVIKNPTVTFPNDFDVYDPKVENNIRTTVAGVTGSRNIEYMAIPRFAGDYEIPEIQFSYFDTQKGSYQTLSAGPYTLHVEQGEGSGQDPLVSNFSNRENLRYLGQDIRYLKLKGITFINKSEIFFGSFMYYMCYLLPALLFIVFFFIYRKQVKENANIAMVRTKKANKMAVRRLKNAGKLMQENKEEAFYEEVLRALWGYLSDKLSIPQSNLSKDNVETELMKYGVGEPLIREFMDILNTCEFARYAPSQAPDTMDKLYKLTLNAIGDMENTIKK